MNASFPTSNFVTEKQAATLLGVSLSTLQQRRFKGQMPRYLKIGKSVRYDLADLMAFAESCRVTPLNP